jgi:hypothetical protein
MPTTSDRSTTFGTTSKPEAMCSGKGVTLTLGIVIPAPLDASTGSECIGAQPILFAIR